MTATFTPDEFLKYFREQRTTLRVKLLPIPAGRFLRKVKEKPPGEELEAIFDRYAAKEPDPSRREPGFIRPVPRLRARARHVLAIRPGRRPGRGRGFLEPGDQIGWTDDISQQLPHAPQGLITRLVAEPVV